MILARHVAIIRARPNQHAALRSSKSMYDNEDQVMRRWMLQVNVSRKGYGNALIGRYGGCFEEDIMRLMYDRAYHAKDLGAPAMFAPSLEVRKGNAWYRRGQQNMDGGSANNRILALVKGTHSLIIGNSLSSQEIHKETSSPRRSAWGLGYPCASSTHDNVTVLFSNSANISDPFSSQSSQLIFCNFPKIQKLVENSIYKMDH